MWKLTIEDDEGKQTAIPLVADEYGLGRAENNLIRLTDRNISRRHAHLRRNGQGWFLTDLQSYNGTYVNGVRVTAEQIIKSGDIVQLGDYRLELIDEATVQHPAGAGEAGGGAAAVEPPHVLHKPDRLVVVVGPSPGTEFPLDREYFTIGRSEEATISINHGSVSRLHAELIALGGGRYEIVDKGSANGIRINGVELRRGILEAGDALELGDVRLRFIGAGKIFRAAEQIQRIHAAAGFENVASSVRAPPAPSPGATLGRVIGVSLLVGTLAVAAVVLAMRSGSTAPAAANPAAPAAATSDDGLAILREAKALLDANDVVGAHKKALQIPERSSAREDEAFKAIEAAWADGQFAKVGEAKTDADKLMLLNEIASTETVDAERRKRAAAMMLAIDKDAPVPQPLRAPPAGGGLGAHAPGGGRPAAAPAASTAAPTAGSIAASPKGPDPAPAALPAHGPPDDMAMRRALEPKVWSGKATLAEIQALRAICRKMGDVACRDRAAAMYKKKQQEQAN